MADKPDTALQRAVEAVGVTDAELSRRTGWTSQQICRVRHGNSNASRALAFALERELAPHITAADLLTAQAV
jgi:hypothetical protein